MQVIDMRLSDIKPYPNNPRRNERAVEKVALSIEAFGFNSPIVVDKDMVIINGHTRYKAAQRLNLETVPVVVAARLSPEQAKAYRIMDNKAGEVAEWDDELLLKEIVDLLDKQDTLPISFTGFDADELARELGLKLGEADAKAKKKKKEIEGEMDFADELLEEHQYLVIYTDNTLDWQVLKEFFGLRSVRRNRTEAAKDRKGLGRCVSGHELISLLRSKGLIE